MLSCWACRAVVRALIKAFSIGLTTSGGNTGRVSMEPGTGSFQVFSISSILRRVWLSTDA